MGKREVYAFLKVNNTRPYSTKEIAELGDLKLNGVVIACKKLLREESIKIATLKKNSNNMIRYYQLAK